MSQKSIFLTGGSGFVGTAVLDTLLARGHRVNVLLRKRPLDRAGVTQIRGDLFDDAALDAGLAGCDAVVHLVGIIREDAAAGQTFERIHHEAAVRVMQRAQALGVKRFIHMSALGARPDSASAYARTKAQAEAFLQSSDLDWTIFRPGLIHGLRGQFMQMLAQWARGDALPYVYMPFFGVGLVGSRSKRVQPVFVDDVARAFADAVDRPETIRQIVPLVGSEVFTWPQMYDVVSRQLLGKPKLAVGHPVWYAKLLTHLLPAKWLPFNHSQVVMAGEDSIADLNEVEQKIGFAPQPFEASFKSYANQL